MNVGNKKLCTLEWNERDGKCYFQCHDDHGDDNDNALRHHHCNDDGAMAVTNAHQHVTHWPISSCDKGSKGAVRPIDRPWRTWVGVKAQEF